MCMCGACGGNHQERQPLIPGANGPSCCKKFWIHVNTLLYNVASCALYLRCMADFPLHIEKLERSILDIQYKETNISMGGKKGLLGFFIAVDMVLLITNQLTMPERLAQMWGCESSSSNTCSTFSSNVRSAFRFISAVLKAIVSSLSLLALVYSIIGIKSLVPAISISGILLVGNGLAQLSNFLNASKTPIPCFPRHLSPGYVKGWSLYSAISYALSNTALYLNTYDAAFMHLGVFNNRLTHCDSSLEKGLFAAGVIFSAIFFLGTIKQYYKSVKQMLEAGERQSDDSTSFSLEDGEQEQRVSEADASIQALEDGSANQSWCKKLTANLTAMGVIIAFWKTAVTFLAQETFFADFSDRNPTIIRIGVGVIAVLSIGNYLVQQTFYDNQEGSLEWFGLKQCKALRFFSSCSNLCRRHPEQHRGGIPHIPF